MHNIWYMCKLYICIYIYIHIHIQFGICIYNIIYDTYVYIYVERERERDRETQTVHMRDIIQIIICTWILFCHFWLGRVWSHDCFPEKCPDTFEIGPIENTIGWLVEWGFEMNIMMSPGILGCPWKFNMAEVCWSIKDVVRNGRNIPCRWPKPWPWKDSIDSLFQADPYTSPMDPFLTVLRCSWHVPD